MPRPQFKCNPEFYYHVTSRCINKDWFQLPLPKVWKIMEDELYFIKHAFKLEIYAFVLMDNHFHLLVRAPQGNLSEAMAFFLSLTSRRIVKKTYRINHVWAHRFKRCEIRNYHYFVNTYKYIYQNPLRAGICKRVEEYPFSTLQGLIGKARMEIPISEDVIFFEEDSSKYFEWINTSPTQESIIWMRKALRRNVFQLPKFRGAKNPLEDKSI